MSIFNPLTLVAPRAPGHPVALVTVQQVASQTVTVQWQGAA